MVVTISGSSVTEDFFNIQLQSSCCVPGTVPGVGGVTGEKQNPSPWRACPEWGKWLTDKRVFQVARGRQGKGRRGSAGARAPSTPDVRGGPQRVTSLPKSGALHCSFLTPIWQGVRGGGVHRFQGNPQIWVENRVGNDLFNPGLFSDFVLLGF